MAKEQYSYGVATMSTYPYTPTKDGVLKGPDVTVLLPFLTPPFLCEDDVGRKTPSKEDLATMIRDTKKGHP